mmetsp:Transcript_25419/g.64555  ORF Transcript_25419/g.64555 Transcript_25419/m.64555 type:complete len:256 (+) Transcript_25419:145-912(+)
MSKEKRYSSPAMRLRPCSTWREIMLVTPPHEPRADAKSSLCLSPPEPSRSTIWVLAGPTMAPSRPATVTLAMFFHLRWWLVRIVTVMVLDVQGKGDDCPDMKVRMAGSTTESTSWGMALSSMALGEMSVHKEEAEIEIVCLPCATSGFSTLKSRTTSSPLLIFEPFLTVIMSLSPMTSATPVSLNMGDSKMPASSAILPGVVTIFMLPDIVWSVWAVRATYQGCTKSPLTKMSRSSRSSLSAALAVGMMSEFCPG